MAAVARTCQHLLQDFESWHQELLQQSVQEEEEEEFEHAKLLCECLLQDLGSAQLLLHESMHAAAEEEREEEQQQEREKEVVVVEEETPHPLQDEVFIATIGGEGCEEECRLLLACLVPATCSCVFNPTSM